MSFIGNIPAEAFSVPTKDTFSGDDSTTDFTLSVPATTNSVEVFVENVQQEPTDAYTIAGTTLSFTAAPVTGTDNIYVIHRGPAVQTVVPPSGIPLSATTVTATGAVTATGDISTEGDLKVETTSGGIYTITGTDTATNRTLTLPDEAGTVLTSATDIAANGTNVIQNSGSAFLVYLSANQAISDNVETKIAFDTEEFDVESDFDSTTNYRFQPTVSGYYQLNGSIKIGSASGSVNRGSLSLYKNGLEHILLFDTGPMLNSSVDPQVSGSVVVFLNGSTDYVELFSTINTSGVDGLIVGNSLVRTVFSGCLVRAA